MNLCEEENENLAEWIESAANGESIEAVAIGESRAHDDEAVVPKNKALPWSEARPHLDYKFDDGYGCPGCHPVCAWTKSRVIFVSEYDGSTRISWLPRHPVDFRPDYDGAYQL